MIGRKKPRKNYRKGRKPNRQVQFVRRIMLGIKVVLATAAVAAVSAFFILVHDYLIQCDYFDIARLTIEGGHRLTSTDIARQAEVEAGDNILAVNLSLVRKRLLAHPWIAEAGVSREIPSGLSIRIREHLPLAVIDVGQKFLINQQGEIFKAWDALDPEDIPVISGLNVLDLPPVHGSADESDSGSYRENTAPFKAVMQVLKLGSRQDSILPNRFIRKIRVDRQIGLTLYAFDQVKAINIGYEDYDGKFNMLGNLLAYLKRHKSVSDFDRIDLNNVDRVVLNPVKIDSGQKDS